MQIFCENPTINWGEMVIEITKVFIEDLEGRRRFSGFEDGRIEIKCPRRQKISERTYCRL